jgi:hypothetical protein
MSVFGSILTLLGYFLFVILPLTAWAAAIVVPIYGVYRGLKKQKFGLFLVSASAFKVVLIAHALWVFSLLSYPPGRDYKAESIAIIKRIGADRFRSDAQVLCDLNKRPPYESVDVPRNSWPTSFRIFQPKLVRVKGNSCTIYFYKMRDDEEGLIVTAKNDANPLPETGKKWRDGGKEFHSSWEVIAKGIHWYSTIY